MWRWWVGFDEGCERAATEYGISKERINSEELMDKERGRERERGGGGGAGRERKGKRGSGGGLGWILG